MRLVDQPWPFLSRTMKQAAFSHVGELEPAGVPQHVGMNEKGEFRGHARPGHHPLIYPAADNGARRSEMKT